ncbi:hypothetical protein QE152_g12995 [Popillia japonica]|uniref:THAP-type domain-containing protein n=1 Tax=Popillia japonica TaxID=7064 RepID=A0AAW1LG18_POPJA
MACAVNGCKNLKRFKPKGVTFYRFPTGSLLNEWLRVLDKEEYRYARSLYSSSSYNKLLLLGGLLIPSEAVVKICQVAETYIRKVMALTGNRIPSEDNLFPSLTIIISQKFYATSDQLFPTLVDHCLSFPSNEEKHTFILIKQIVNAYLRIRIFSLAILNNTTVILRR